MLVYVWGKSFLTSKAHVADKIWTNNTYFWCAPTNWEKAECVAYVRYIHSLVVGNSGICFRFERSSSLCVCAGIFVSIKVEKLSKARRIFDRNFCAENWSGIASLAHMVPASIQRLTKLCDTQHSGITACSTAMWCTISSAIGFDVQETTFVFVRVFVCVYGFGKCSRRSKKKKTTFAIVLTNNHRHSYLCVHFELWECVCFLASSPELLFARKNLIVERKSVHNWVWIICTRSCGPDGAGKHLSIHLICVLNMERASGLC